MQHYKTKVCIVGSGVSGCLCAKYLSQSVNDILIVERGDRLTHNERLKTGKHENEIATASHNDIAAGEYKKHLQYAYTLGGTTNMWLGQSPRMLPSDFKTKTLYGIANDWLIDYNELERYYCLAEDELAIAGANDNPRLPRSKPFPLSPHPLSQTDLVLQKCFPKAGVVACAQARPTRSVGNRPKCCGSATCYLCPVDSKYTPMNTHVPQLESYPSVRFLHGAAVVALQTAGSRITGAHIRQSDGKEAAIQADIFVLSANGLENAAILLRSSGVPHHPVVGKFLFDHPGFTATAIISEDAAPYYAHSLYTAHLYHFYDGEFRRRRAGALGEIRNTAQFQPSDFAATAAVRNRLRGQALRNEITKQFRRQISVDFLLDDLPQEQRCLKVSSRKDALGIPLTEIYYTDYSSYVQSARDEIVGRLPSLLEPAGFRELRTSEFVDGLGHILGTCRMGNPSEGAVDADLRYHGLDNLYVLGGSAFPAYSPANPTLTIAALAVRLGMHLRNF